MESMETEAQDAMDIGMKDVSGNSSGSPEEVDIADAPQNAPSFEDRDYILNENLAQNDREVLHYHQNFAHLTEGREKILAGT